jgi:hypothetical protein
MNQRPPSFLEQERLQSILRSTFRRSTVQATGAEPSGAQIEAFVQREIPALAEEYGTSFLVRLSKQPAPTAPPVVDLPADGSIENAWLTSAQRREAESALWFAKLHGIESITEALRWHSVCNRAAMSAPLVSQCADQFHLAKRQEKLSPRTMHHYHLRLGNFVKQFGSRRPATITPKELTAYLSRWAHPNTRLGHWVTVSTFFNWMLRSRYILENPLTGAMRRPMVKNGQCGL